MPNAGDLDEITFDSVDHDIGPRGEDEFAAMRLAPDAASVWKLPQCRAAFVNSAHDLIGGFWIVLTNILFDPLEIVDCIRGPAQPHYERSIRSTRASISSSSRKS